MLDDLPPLEAEKLKKRRALFQDAMVRLETQAPADREAEPLWASELERET